MCVHPLVEYITIVFVRQTIFNEFGDVGAKSNKISGPFSGDGNILGKADHRRHKFYLYLLSKKVILTEVQAQVFNLDIRIDWGWKDRAMDQFISYFVLK